MKEDGYSIRLSENLQDPRGSNLLDAYNDGVRDERNRMVVVVEHCMNSLLREQIIKNGDTTYIALEAIRDCILKGETIEKMGARVGNEKARVSKRHAHSETGVQNAGVRRNRGTIL